MVVDKRGGSTPKEKGASLDTSTRDSFHGGLRAKAQARKAPEAGEISEMVLWQPVAERLVRVVGSVLDVPTERLEETELVTHLAHELSMVLSDDMDAIVEGHSMLTPDILQLINRKKRQLEAPSPRTGVRSHKSPGRGRKGAQLVTVSL